MDISAKNVLFFIFMIWGFPLGYYRNKFRKIVYNTDNWIINFKPLFWKELKGLFGNIYPENNDYKKIRNFYLFYLSTYLLLLLLYIFI
jgi:peroxiredoxin Q/BCP